MGIFQSIANFFNDEPETPYERGYRAGQWSEEQVEAIGYDSPEQCLKHVEKTLQGQINNPGSLSPEYAERHTQYLQGSLDAARDTLGGRKRR